MELRHHNVYRIDGKRCREHRAAVIHPAGQVGIFSVQCPNARMVCAVGSPRSRNFVRWGRARVPAPQVTALQLECPLYDADHGDRHIAGAVGRQTEVHLKIAKQFFTRNRFDADVAEVRFTRLSVGGMSAALPE